MTNTKNNQKNILGIVGFGVEGKAIYDFYTSSKSPFLFEKIYIFDEKLTELPTNLTAGTNTVLVNNLEIPAEVTFLVKSPGVATHKLKLNNPNININSLVSIIFDQFKANNLLGQTIAVTGTKGKSSTSSLIYHILTTNGKKVELLGNIGAINIDLLKAGSSDTYYVFELSSFQCQQLKVSPHIAVWTNFFVDHQDVHIDMGEYFEAKRQITAHQIAQDFFITIPSLLDTKTKAQKISTENLCFETKLLGEHNQINCELAYLTCQKLGLSETQIHSAIATYQPLKGRLELVGTKDNIEFYADDLATIPEATWSAIQSFKSNKTSNKKLTTLIVGGYDKGLNYEDLANKLVNTDIETYIYFEPTGSKIVAKLDRNKVKILEAKSMQEAVSLAYQHTKSDLTCTLVCLLSCASASFGLFKNAYDRGEQYRQCVENL